MSFQTSSLLAKKFGTVRMAAATIDALVALPSNTEPSTWMSTWPIGTKTTETPM